MHISEGVLSAPVLAGGAAVAIAGIWIGLKKMQPDQIAVTGVMAAAFFVATLIHIPIGVANAHLLFCGLTGVILGWGAFPALFTGLALQAMLFQYGGITTLGVNTATMGSAAVGAWYLFRLILHIWPGHLKVAGFIAGAAGVALSGILTACALAFTNEGFAAAALALLAAHLPIMLAEGIITSFTVAFLAHARPGFLNTQIFQRHSI